MSINFAAIAPHPPIIVPGIAASEDMKKTAETIVGMRKLSSVFNEADIDTLIIISPHGLIYPDCFNICQMQKLFGTFASFDHPDIMVEAENNLDFVDLLRKKMDEREIPVDFYDNDGEFFELDHGAMVPLSFLKQNQETSFKVVPISYSQLDHDAHVTFGQVIMQAAREYPGRVGILASGDLSHQLFQNPEGKKFDQKLVDNIKNQRYQDIIDYDEETLQGVGECGYRSILILLGALTELENHSEVLSYEGPFGVGYLVANFKLPED